MTALLVAGLLPLLGSLLLPGLTQPRARSAGAVATGVVVTVFLLVATSIPRFIDSPGSASFPWIPQLGLSVSILADGLSLLFALLISGIGVGGSFVAT